MPVSSNIMVMITLLHNSTKRIFGKERKKFQFRNLNYFQLKRKYEKEKFAGKMKIARPAF